MDCIFCKIAKGEIPSSTLYEDDEFRVILDLNPAAKGHALVLPKKHYDNACGMPVRKLGRAMQIGAGVAQAEIEAFGYDGFNLVQNNGTAAGQSVFHFHLHVIPRREGDEVLGLWKPGKTTRKEMSETASAVKACLPHYLSEPIQLTDPIRRKIVEAKM